MNQPHSWQCEDCGYTIWLHPDPKHDSHVWVRREQDACASRHAQQLIEHGGDRESLRTWLKFPAHWESLQQAKRKQHAEHLHAAEKAQEEERS